MARTALLLLVAAALTAVEPLDPVLGDWSADGAPVVQVIPLGGGAYRAHVVEGVMQAKAPIAVLLGQAQNGVITFSPAPTGQVESGKDVEPKENSWWPAPATSAAWQGVLANGTLNLTGPAGTVALHQVEHPSPTLGAPAPAGAVVLIGPGISNPNQVWGRFKSGKIIGDCGWAAEADGVLRCVPKSGDIATRQSFGDCRWHVEFNLAFEPANRGQHRSNSGVLTQERYELQVLDSYGLMGLFNETGALYRSAKPLVNACLPPGRWQTYDVDFTAARVGQDQQVQPARFTVRLNGVLVQDRTELDHCTGARSKRPLTNVPGPFMLQDHDHPVAFRNMWVVPGSASAP